MRNILLNKIDEKLIAISRIKDSMDESVYDDKIYYENLIKSLINEIKTLLDEFYSLTQKESKPLETIPMPKISYTEEGYIKMEIPFLTFSIQLKITFIPCLMSLRSKNSQ